MRVFYAQPSVPSNSCILLDSAREAIEYPRGSIDLAFCDSCGFISNLAFESGLTAAERLLDLMPRPTAIFASNDEMAAGVMHAARQRGLDIPKDLSIVGFDDTPVAAHVWPPLTTVRWPIASMARSAALKLTAGLDGEQIVEEPSLFLSTLIRRGSVAAPSI